MILHRATFAQLDATTLYRLLQLRTTVFVVEQQCPFPDLDGRDVEPTAQHLWFARGNDPLSYLRLVRDPHSWRIGRVCTAAPARGQGLSARLLAAALETTEGPHELDAQSHLTAFYRRFGFTTCGPEYVEDGIPHTPMRREP